MGNAIDAVFQAVKRGYADYQESAKRRMLLADIKCIDGMTKPDGAVNGEALDFCRRMQAIKINDGRSHGNVVIEDKQFNTDGSGYSFFTFNADIGQYYKKCVEIRKSFPKDIYAIGFCGKKIYSVTEDGTVHGKIQDKADLLSLRDAIKRTFNIDLPVVVDHSTEYYLWGTNIWLFTNIKHIDPATLK